MKLNQPQQGIATQIKSRSITTMKWSVIFHKLQCTFRAKEVVALIMKGEMGRLMICSDYLKLGKHCIALPGITSEYIFIKPISCWSVGRSMSILSFILVLIQCREVMCL
jgi:hypothetical protein